jgi:hypothetical protein
MSTKRKKNSGHPANKRSRVPRHPHPRRTPSQPTVYTFANAYRPHPRRDIELVPSAVENEVIAQWQDFAEARGHWVSENLRVPNISEFNEELPWSLSFAMPEPSSEPEHGLWSEFVRAAFGGVHVEVGERHFTAKPKNIVFGIGHAYTGWVVTDESDVLMRPADLDWCRTWASDITASRVWKL